MAAISLVREIAPFYTARDKQGIRRTLEKVADSFGQFVLKGQGVPAWFIRGRLVPDAMDFLTLFLMLQHGLSLQALMNYRVDNYSENKAGIWMEL